MKFQFQELEFSSSLRTEIPDFTRELKFQFRDGYPIHAHVFTANDFEGEARETDEAIPLWTSLDAIPYPEMWQDNPLWMPLLLEGVPFSGRYVFDGDSMLDYEIDQRFDTELAESISLPTDQP